jgi:indolepyruvate decarboxylase
VALAAPGRRTILVTGEGSHQLTAQEVSQFHRFGLKPIIFVLDEAIKTAEARGTGAYIEVVTDRYAASPLAKKYHESIETLYAV